MEPHSNTDSNMLNMDSNINSSARFLVQFHPQNRPYREQCAEQHESVADFDIETANPYLVEMHTSWFLSKLIRTQSNVPKSSIVPSESKVPTSSNVPSKPVPVQAPSAVGKEKGSSSTGGTEVKNDTVDLNKKQAEARRAANQENLLQERAKRVENANAALKRKKERDEAYRKQQRQEEMARSKSSSFAMKARNDRQVVQTRRLLPKAKKNGN